MKMAFAILTLLIIQSSYADVINCTFSDDSYRLEINSEAKTLKMTKMNETGEQETKTLSTTIMTKKLESKASSDLLEIPRYEIIDVNGESIILELSYKGNDGTSDMVYPYEAKRQGKTGACESKKAMKLNPNYEEEIIDMASTSSDEN